MRAPFVVLWLVAAASAGCTGCYQLDRRLVPAGPPSDCDAGDAAFVVDATLALLGQRPRSHTEVELGANTIAAFEQEHPGEGRRRWALQLMEHPAFVERWSELVLDDLYVPRTGIQAMGECYGDARLGDPALDGDVDLALFVRDNVAIDDVFADSFTFLDLLKQSLVLDDLSPSYRAHLYALLTRLNACGNVDAVGQELAFRDEVGHTFEAAYLNRDPVCLACHTTSFAVTDRDDPDADRHWPLKGRFEDSVFGAGSVDDPRVPRAVFRVDSFVNGGAVDFGFLDPTVAYCFDAATMNLLPADCDPALLPCPDGFDPFCLGPFDFPQCVDDGAGGQQTSCGSTPFCLDASFQNVDVVTCEGGVAGCAPEFPILACPATDDVPLCDDQGVPFCPDAAGEGEGEGDVVDDGSSFSPWGADRVCGSFARQVPSDDPAAIDAHFASVVGRRVSVVQLEQALKRGVDALAVLGLRVDDDDNIRNPDEAFAYLVAANIVDNTWREVIGSPLTIATHFPRNQSQRDVLQSLTDDFVARHFSLKELLADVVTSGYLNLQPPENACSDAFAYPPIFDPWTREEPEPEARNNAASDAVHALSARTLLSAGYAALGWPRPASEAFPEGAATADLDFGCFDLFPDCPTLESACLEGQCCPEKDAACGASTGPLTETEIQGGVGVFHGISEKGFRGLDFQALLFFEARFGSCEKPADVDHDAIDDIVSRGNAAGSVRDTVLALKERLINDTSFDGAERQQLEALFGGSLDQPAAGVVNLESSLRVVCGALLASPQFQLTGVAPPSPSPPARLQPSVDEVCREPLPGCR